MERLKEGDIVCVDCGYVREEKCDKCPECGSILWVQIGKIRGIAIDWK
jgi:predicted Zn-ribbon and HTH transcriptional regulator